MLVENTVYIYVLTSGGSPLLRCPLQPVTTADDGLSDDAPATIPEDVSEQDREDSAVASVSAYQQCLWYDYYHLD